MLPPYMQGTPDELRQRAQQGRAAQDQQYRSNVAAFDSGPEGYMNGPLGHNAAWAMKSRPWSPALDALESFSYQSPEYQNQSFASAAQGAAPGPMSPWQTYSAVLNARGAQSPFGGAPSSIAQNPQSTWNTNPAFKGLQRYR